MFYSYNHFVTRWILSYQEPTVAAPISSLAILENIKFKEGILRTWNFKDDQERIMWNFDGSWFLALKIPMGVTQFLRMSMHEVTNLKVTGVFFKKSCPQSPTPPPPPVLIFSGIA